MSAPTPPLHHWAAVCRRPSSLLLCLLQGSLSISWTVRAW